MHVRWPQFDWLAHSNLRLPLAQLWLAFSPSSTGSCWPLLLYPSVLLRQLALGLIPLPSPAHRCYHKGLASTGCVALLPGYLNCYQMGVLATDWGYRWHHWLQQAILCDSSCDLPGPLWSPAEYHCPHPVSAGPQRLPHAGLMNLWIVWPPSLFDTWLLYYI